MVVLRGCRVKWVYSIDVRVTWMIWLIKPNRDRGYSAQPLDPSPEIIYLDTPEDGFACSNEQRVVGIRSRRAICSSSRHITLRSTHYVELCIAGFEFMLYYFNGWVKLLVSCDSGIVCIAVSKYQHAAPRHRHLLLYLFRHASYGESNLQSTRT